VCSVSLSLLLVCFLMSLLFYFRKVECCDGENISLEREHFVFICSVVCADRVFGCFFILSCDLYMHDVSF
jgi:hypothetical protein